MEKTVRVARDGPVGIVRLDRPKVLNALSLQVMDELVEAYRAMDDDPAVRAVVVTGSERAFAAGADIAEMASATAVEMLERDQFAKWARLRQIKKPVIAAVEGYALGGGFELAMSCDMIICGESARLGQPEIKIGVMPGAGGTQLLTRAVGKWRAMELVLTGRLLSAREALACGLLTRVVPEGMAYDEAVRLGRAVAEMPPVAVRLAKEAVLKAFMTSPDEGLALERKNFYLLFASQDRTEGMQAFLEKRTPHWQGK